METNTRHKHARKLAEEHAVLRDQQQLISGRLDQWAADPAGEGARAEVAKTLGDFRDALRRHFEQEERGGFFEKDNVNNPSAGREFEGLLGEHREFERRIDALLGRVEEHSERSDPLPEALERDLRELVTDLAQHEQHEVGMLQRLVIRETGQGD